MQKIISLTLLMLSVCLHLNAQQEAVTRDGKIVILLENGTWKYATPRDNLPSKETVVIKNIDPDAPLLVKDLSLEPQLFIDGPSAKLKKYFKTANIVRCEFSIKGKDGKVFLQTDWKIQTAQAFSYFGYIKKGNLLTLELLTGKVVDLIFIEESIPEEFKKYGFSTFSSQIELTPQQIALLQSGVVVKATMNWSRRSEEYVVKNPAYFIGELPKVLKQPDSH